MSIENNNGGQLNPQLRKRFFVWLNFTLKFMPKSIRESGIKIFRYELEERHGIALRGIKTHEEFVCYVKEFVKITYSGYLGEYYGIENLINLVDQINSEFKAFFKIINHGDCD